MLWRPQPVQPIQPVRHRKATSETPNVCHNRALSSGAPNQSNQSNQFAVGRLSPKPTQFAIIELHALAPQRLPSGFTPRFPNVCRRSRHLTVEFPRLCRPSPRLNLLRRICHLSFDPQTSLPRLYLRFPPNDYSLKRFCLIVDCFIVNVVSGSHPCWLAIDYLDLKWIIAG
jgi:hypothetical protein